MKNFITKLFGDKPQRDGEIFDESIEKLADLLVASYEAKQTARTHAAKDNS